MSYANDKVRGFFQQSKGCNFKINDTIWPVFQSLREYIHVHLIYKFQEDPIKTEWVKLMTKSNRGFFFFFSNQGDLSLALMIRSGQFFNLFKISSMSTLSASFRKIQSKLRTVLRCCIGCCIRFCGTGQFLWDWSNDKFKSGLQLLAVLLIICYLPREW